MFKLLRLPTDANKSVKCKITTQFTIVTIRNISNSWNDTFNSSNNECELRMAQSDVTE